MKPLPIFICVVFTCIFSSIILYIEVSKLCSCDSSRERFSTENATSPTIECANKPSTEYPNSKLSGSRSCNGTHPLSCDEPYSSRLLHVKEVCRRNTPQEYSLRSRFYKFSDKLKLIMCETPKVGSTTLQKTMAFLDPSYAERNSGPTVPKVRCGQWGNECFMTLTEEEARKRTSTFTSFLVTRHPLERVVSAYIDKLKKNDVRFREELGKRIALAQAKEYLHNVSTPELLKEMEVKDTMALKAFQTLSESQKQDVLKYIKVLKTGEISFPQLVRYLVEYYLGGRADKIDRHWIPQVLICQPCAFNYSYIMRFDSLTKDSNRMWDYVVDYLKFMVFVDDVHVKMGKTAATNEITTEYYKQVPEAHVQILRDFYKDDFTFYNYDPYLYRGY